GRTPLLWAVSWRHDRVAKLLLERRYFVPNQAAADQVPAVSSTERSGLPQSSFKWILISWFSPWKQVIPTRNTRLALRIAIDMCFLISTLFFFLYYFLIIA